MLIIHTDKWWQKLPWVIIILIFILCVYGLVVLYSASYIESPSRIVKQASYIAVFFPVSIGIAFINLKYIYRFSYIFYIITILLLLGVSLFGYTAKGAVRWINCYGIKLQPSELSKLSIILFLACYFHRTKINNFRELLIPFVAVAIPTTLTILQPDLGSGILILGISLVMFFATGISHWYFIIFIGGSLCAIPILWTFLHEYQKKRILVFWDPELDSLGAGYNIIQSKIAIGSGNIWGKGFLHGTQSHLNFLPEHQTDFIFALLAEEFGLIGCIILIFLLFALIFYYTLIGINCRNKFGKLLCIGVAGMLFINSFVNIAMAIGLSPVVGVPLPFMSYGGTVITTAFLANGLVMNVYANNSKKII